MAMLNVAVPTDTGASSAQAGLGVLSQGSEPARVRGLFKEKAEVQKCPIDRLARLSAGDISAVIQMAWEDRTTFETIQERLGLNESDVIALMRAELNPSSFKLWRMRVRGRVTKHRALRSPQMKYDDHAVADHRRANC